MMMGISSAFFGQVPSGYTIVKTHNDDITWYEARDDTWYCVFYNGKRILFTLPEHVKNIFYSHDLFIVERSYGFEVYDTQGQQRLGVISRYEVIIDDLYLVRNSYPHDEVYDSNCNLVGGGLKKVNGKWFLITKENYKYGITDLTNDEEIIAPEFDDCDCLGGDLFKFMMNGYWGVMNRQGKIIIPLSRHYTSIDYSRTLKIFTFTKETEAGYFKGECNASGVQTSIEKTGTKSKPKQQTQQPKQETKPQQPKQETKPKQETVTPTPQPQPQPQPKPVPPQPQPMQVWKPCPYCQGTGQCQTCLGTGHTLMYPCQDRCWNCSGTGKCTHCAGHGGHNEIEYH